MRSEQMSMSTEVGQSWDTASGAAELDLGEQTVTLLRSRLPEVAEQTVRAIIVQVPAYTDALSGPIGANIRSAVELALGGFLRLAGGPSAAAAGSPLAPALDGAYALGRGEARSGRSMEALLAAYPSAPARRGVSSPGPRSRTGCPRTPWPGSPSSSSRTSTNCRRPARPAIPTSWRPPDGFVSGT